MPLITRKQLIYALATGGLVGILGMCGFCYSTGKGMPDVAGLATGAWVGFIVACGVFMIKNAAPSQTGSD